MLIRHGALYFAARIVPGAMSLLALALFTRLMSTGEYGHYALVVAGAGVLNAVCFHWLSLSLTRFLPAHKSDPEVLLATLLVALLKIVVVTGAIGVVAIAFAAGKWLVAAVVVVAWAQAWFDMNLALANIEMVPVRYGMLSSLKAVLALSVGAALFLAGLGVLGVLLGLLASLLLSPLLLWKRWRSVALGDSSRALSRDLLHFGSPLAITFALAFIVSMSDRFLLGWMVGVGAAGAYAAANDLTVQSLGMLMGVVHLAGFPLTVRALEEKGVAAAQSQLKEHAFLLTAIALPATAGMATLADNFAAVFLGAEFREVGRTLIPWVAIATFVGLTRAYCLDYSFHLGRKMYVHARVMGFAAATNIALNLACIPAYGQLGAAYAALGAAAAGFAASWALGRRVLPIPFPGGLHRLVLATLCMEAALWPLRALQGLGGLLIQVFVGGITYGVALLLVGPRHDLRERLRSTIKRMSP